MAANDKLYDKFVRDNIPLLEKLYKQHPSQLTRAQLEMVTYYAEHVREELFLQQKKVEQEQEAFRQREAVRASEHMVAFQEGDSILDAAPQEDAPANYNPRQDLINKLSRVIPTDKFATKYAELLDAHHEVKDEHGKVIARKPDYNTQRKTMELLADVMGHKAPLKREVNSTSTKQSVTAVFVNPDKFAAARDADETKPETVDGEFQELFEKTDKTGDSDIDEAALYAKEKLEAIENR